MPRAQASNATYEYVPEFGRAVRILEYDRPMRSDDEETAQTVSYMDELATRDANDPAISGATAEALGDAGIDASADDFSKACAVYWWLKRTVRYVATPGTSPLVDQTLIPPCTILAMPEPIGDCPQFSMLAAAMFRCLCMNSRFVTIAAEREFPDQWSHIYNTVEVAPGVYMPFDSSNGPEPGAEYARPFKKRVWPRLSPGKCRTKEVSPMLRGTHRNSFRGMRSASLRGAMGDVTCDQDGNCYDDSTETFTPAPIAPEIPGGYGYISPADAATMSNQATSTGILAAQSLTPPVTSSSSLTPAGSATPWYDLLVTDAANAFSKINASTQKPYYITSATGQSVLYNPATGTVSSPSALGSINPLYLAAGLGLFALVAMMGKK